MCTHNLNRLIGTAVVDKDFRNKLLGDPGLSVMDFGLTPEELLAVTSVRASDIADFAQKLEAVWSMEVVPVGGPYVPMPERRREVMWTQPPDLLSGRPLALHLS